tara:strand:- start:1173 stop:1484 length:312 start_codon:yes stop_codon:yes gene_type:complete
MALNGKITLEEAILKINPNASMGISGDDVDQIEWLESTTPISKADILAKQTELQTEYDALDYARKREAEYPKIGDQLDKIYHEGIDAWKADMITPIKNKYPKG